MKSTILLTAAIASTVAVAQAIDTTSPTWSIVDNHDGTYTWSTTITGAFNIDLGYAAPISGESFVMTIENTTTEAGNNNGFANMYSTSFGTGTDPYYSGQSGTDQFRFEFGNPAKNTNFITYVNGWTYSKTATLNLEGAVSETNPLTLGAVFTYTAEGDNNFTVAPSENSMMTWETITDANVVRTYAFQNITNASTTDPTGITPTGTTTITIVKSTPEPATATLSLLALTGLAARRRRH